MPTAGAELPAVPPLLVRGDRPFFRCFALPGLVAVLAVFGFCNIFASFERTSSKTCLSWFGVVGGGMKSRRSGTRVDPRVCARRSARAWESLLLRCHTRLRMCGMGLGSLSWVSRFEWCIVILRSQLQPGVVDAAILPGLGVSLIIVSVIRVVSPLLRR